MQLATEETMYSSAVLQEEVIIHGYQPQQTEHDLAILTTKRENGYFTQLPTTPEPTPVLGMYTELQRAEHKTLFVDYTWRNNVWWQKYVTL